MSQQEAQALAPLAGDAIVGRRVHMTMWERGITQTTLGPRVGIEQSSLAKKLKGKRGWSVNEILAIAHELNVSVAFLFGEQEHPGGPGDGAEGWAPSGSNRRPADYRSVVSLRPVVNLLTRRQPQQAS